MLAESPNQNSNVVNVNLFFDIKYFSLFTSLAMLFTQKK